MKVLQREVRVSNNRNEELFVRGQHDLATRMHFFVEAEIVAHFESEGNVKFQRDSFCEVFQACFIRIAHEDWSDHETEITSMIFSLPACGQSEWIFPPQFLLEQLALGDCSNSSLLCLHSCLWANYF